MRRNISFHRGRKAERLNDGGAGESFYIRRNFLCATHTYIYIYKEEEMNEVTKHGEVGQTTNVGLKHSRVSE